MNTRKAHTLIELSMTMSVGSALMLVAVGLIHQSLSLTSAAQHRAAMHRVIDRISHDIRNDTHHSQMASSSESHQVQLVRDDGSIVLYTTENDRIRREERLDGVTVRQDEYELSETIRATFDLLDHPRRVSLVLQSRAAAVGPHHAAARRISAVVGRTLAHQRAEVQP